MQPNLTRLFALDGRRALVTGASSGLGRHFAMTLAAAGAEVVVTARRQAPLQALVEAIEVAGGRAQAFALDVTCREDICRVLDAAGPLDVLACDDQSWDRVLDTNLKGAWAVAQESARRMVAAGKGGSLINVTSILASRVAGAVGPYLAAKAGLAHLTRAMALELARHGIRVNALAPGYVMTDLNEAFLASEAGDKLRSRIPSRRFSVPADLDGALLLLASDAGRAMSGAEIVVDGGHLCSSL
ncbi:SDR family oxidoreductase [Pseudomonas aeruginosa]|uniref:SDR family NAD(P)-dependent oxidoreductase n=1 Tax=Pseudomonas aeruginosa TaxID=287 RepID=UPI0020447390|nr:SDR family NAD(P)-dependent oxidoreductase [Pseudomonas aeruginosa]MCM3914004.1 SDR family oxidoreductase [Pseudomonas aeruginosa]MCM3938036.1 SDR family oxidoreductase [Pseudomonas aeruginosa]MCM3950038.1 SDR family oxidoreductase [Pseudomonas aeruginosa]MCM3998066.1 SDR family oxidoreductase [Pseudomonas aeruginosa]MCM4010362.1 SDR family oxidoreductase [Pseudomonas aeruginosa]